MSDRKVKAVSVLLEVLSPKNATKDMIRGYILGLSSLTDEQTERGVSILLQNWTINSTPRPADIKEAALGVSKQDLELEVAKIVGDIEDAFSQGGIYASHVFSPRSMWVINYLGGLLEINRLDDTQMAWLRKKDIPEALRICPAIPDVDHLVGLTEGSPSNEDRSPKYRLVDHTKKEVKFLQGDTEYAQSRKFYENGRIGEGKQARRLSGSSEETRENNQRGGSTPDGVQLVPDPIRGAEIDGKKVRSCESARGITLPACYPH